MWYPVFKVFKVLCLRCRSQRAQGVEIRGREETEGEREEERGRERERERTRGRERGEKEARAEGEDGALGREGGGTWQTLTLEDVCGAWFEGDGVRRAPYACLRACRKDSMTASSSKVRMSAGTV